MIGWMLNVNGLWRLQQFEERNDVEKEEEKVCVIPAKCI